MRGLLLRSSWGLSDQLKAVRCNRVALCADCDHRRAAVDTNLALLDASGRHSKRHRLFSSKSRQYRQLLAGAAQAACCPLQCPVVSPR